MCRYVFKLIDHELIMAGVAVRKADDPSLQDELDQRYAQLPPEFLPTAQQIQDTISDTGIARTPQEFEQTEPLGGKNESGRGGYTARRYLHRLATEGALAEGLVRRKFPLLDEYNVDATKLPVLRDYTSRQTTLPEHFLSMQTEGPHFDEHGNILPGAIPPVNAIKRLGATDIKDIGSAGNFGLKPLKDARVNFDWEKGIPNYRDTLIDLARQPLFPVKHAGFVSPTNSRDVKAAEAANVDPRNPTGLVAIRGFGAPSDKAFSRKDMNEGREGIYTAPIPPERLVGIHRQGGLDEKDVNENILNTAFDDENIVRQINLPENIPKRDFILNEMKRADATNDLAQFEIEMETLYENGELSEKERDAALDSFEIGRKLQRKRNREELPEEWNQGSFGFNNPILTPKEKKQYERQIMEIMSQTQAGRNAGPTGIQELQDYLRQGHNPALYPRPVKKALPRHWSKDFDTVEEAMREAQAARMASKRELGNIEDIPITPGTLEWELGLTRDGKARSLIPGVSAGRVIDQGLVDQGGAFAYPALRQSFFPSLHPEVMGRRAGVPIGRGSENMMMFTTEKPMLHATQNEGREQTEAFYPGGFDPAQTYLLSDPTKTFRRNDLEEANRAFMGRNENNFAEGTEGADTPVGRIVAPMSNLVNNTQNPHTVQPWGRPQTVEDVFQLSEPMEIAMQLLKERVSPEAKRHKLEYDKKYESSPERVKYREELNRERRRRGIYGSHDHKDISHTEGGKLTLEGEHENRARHFKDKGTLRHE